MAWDVVIAGGGFGGYNAARTLERAMPRGSARITLVNEVNFLLYTPFLPEAAAGTLEPRHVVTPLRQVLDHTRLMLGTVTARDPARRTVTVHDERGEDQQLHYDRLILSLGSVSRVLPIPGLAEHGVGFKSLADAIYLRNRVVQSLELADATDDERLREQLLTFVFVGGGYAGLEALAELQDFASDAIEVYPSAKLHGTRWIVVEAQDRVLREVDPELADYAVHELRGRGIDIRLGTTLTELTDDSATLSTGETIPTRTLVWTAGVKPNPGADLLGLPLNAQGRIETDDHLRVPGEDGIYAIGDAAAVPDPANPGGICPPTAQHSIRQGRTAARNVAAALGVGRAKPFKYKAKGQFVNLGRHKAVAMAGPLKFRGFPAWWMARTYHLSQIPSLSRKVHAAMDWTVGLPFGRDTAEVGSIGHPERLGDPPPEAIEITPAHPDR